MSRSKCQLSNKLPLRASIAFSKRMQHVNFTHVKPGTLAKCLRIHATQMPRFFKLAK